MKVLPEVKKREANSCMDGTVSGPKDEEWPEEEKQQIAQMLFGEELSFPSSWSRNLQDNARSCVDNNDIL